MCLVKKLGALMARGRKKEKKENKKKEREEVLASNGSSELSIVLQFFNIYVTLKTSSPSPTFYLIYPSSTIAHSTLTKSLQEASNKLLQKREQGVEKNKFW